MDLLAYVLASATELDLLKVGEKFAVGASPRTAIGILQALLRKSEVPFPGLLGELSDDTLRLVCGRAGLALGGSRAERVNTLLRAVDAPVGDEATALTVDVPHRKPRLAWHGMHRQPLAVAVPTQVVEVVSPGRAEAKADDGQYDGLVARTPGRDRSLPPNRLIWTNDNLIALRSLLDEKDPVTRDWRYRGKVDLVYIDPPFMVNSDFRADNAIDIQLDEDGGVQATKEPSLVEIIAYKDTWRDGLDSFLTTLRDRLALLKQLLAPTGSIYVHLDWHAAHYVKVVMDEVFGYEGFRGEVIWKRTSARSDAEGLNHVHDIILSYGASATTFWSPIYDPLSTSYIRSHYTFKDDASGRRYRLDNLTSPNPRPNMTYAWKGYTPPPNGWRYEKSRMAELDEAGLIHYPEKGGRLAFKRFLDDDGMPAQSIWTEISPVNSQAAERLGYPTQKPVALLERIISASCPPGGLVLDCYAGSGTTAEAAERLGRRWIAVDIGKFAVHLARKRLIQLHGQPRPPEKAAYDYVECEACNNIERKPKRQKSPGPYKVRPFTLENIGVYQRAETWQDIQTEKSVYRDEMVRVFGGEPVDGYELLHGRKGAHWVHVGPLDAPIAVRQIWSIAREASRTDTLAITVLSADVITLSGDEKSKILADVGVDVVVRIIPASAIDEVRNRLKRQRRGDGAVESMAVPAFYAPLSIALRHTVEGRLVKVTLDRCEIDIESFLSSQQPLLKPITADMSATGKKKAEGERDRWDKRRAELEKWLGGATSWQAFVDFWAVDWDFGDHVGPDDRTVFDTDWQSFRVRRGKGAVDPLLLTAEYRYAQPGKYQIAARVTDVFGNDGIATVEAEVRT